MKRLILAGALVLAACGGQSKFGDGVIDIDGDGQGVKVNVVTISLALARGTEAAANLYVGLPSCEQGQSFIKDQCSKPEIVSKLNLGLPPLGLAIDTLSPLVDSTDQAAIDSALALVDKAIKTVTEARDGE